MVGLTAQTTSKGCGGSFSYLPPTPQWQAPAGFALQALLGILTPLPLALPKTLSSAAILGRHSPLPIPVPLLSLLSDLLMSHTAPLAECQRTLAVSELEYCPATTLCHPGQGSETPKPSL